MLHVGGVRRRAVFPHSWRIPHSQYAIMYGCPDNSAELNARQTLIALAAHAYFTRNAALPSTLRSLSQPTS